MVPVHRHDLQEERISSTTLNYAVYVSGSCMARFVHAPDAAHFRQQLIHRIREESPDLDPVLVAAGVTVEDAPHESLRHQADGLPVHVWLVWADRCLVSVHASRMGAEAARRQQLRARRADDADSEAAIIVTTACIQERAGGAHRSLE